MRGLPTTRTGELAFAAILFDLLHGRVPTLQSLQASRDVGDAVGPVLDDLEKIGAIVKDGSGAIVAAYPLSAVPTGHRIQLDSLQPWANCAFDALAVPSMLGRRGIISSLCAHCREPIRVVVEGATVVASSPLGIMVSYGGLANCSDRPSLEVSCPFIHFFCSAQHAHAWVQPEGWVGQLLTLGAATTLAVARFRPVIELYQRYAPTLLASGMAAQSRAESYGNL